MPNTHYKHKINGENKLEITSKQIQWFLNSPHAKSTL
jgi:hypothetical protein